MSDPPDDDIPQYEDKDVQPDFEADGTAWQTTNMTFKKMYRLRRRTDDVVHGRTKSLIGYGPPGIAKTHNVMHDLRVYAVQQKKIWEQMDLDDPYRERRTILVEGLEEFRYRSFVVMAG